MVKLIFSIAKIATALWMLLIPTTSHASDFWDLWVTPDQRGRIYFLNQNYDQAAQFFQNKHWKVLSYYKGGNFLSVLEILEDPENPDLIFLKANSLARLERLEEAVKEYEKLLKIEPDHEEAKFNLNWVDGLLKLDQKEYDDNGGTGGKLGADRVTTGNFKNEKGTTVTKTQLKSEGLTEQQLEQMWMRRVDTDFGQFLSLRFAYQLQNQQKAQ